MTNKVICYFKVRGDTNQTVTERSILFRHEMPSGKLFILNLSYLKTSARYRLSSHVSQNKLQHIDSYRRLEIDITQQG